MAVKQAGKLQPTDEQDLESQLDAMVAHIQSTDEAGSESPEVLSRTSFDMDLVGTTESVEDLIGDDLASQIQELLDEAKGQGLMPAQQAAPSDAAATEEDSQATVELDAAVEAMLAGATFEDVASVTAEADRPSPAQPLAMPTRPVVTFDDHSDPPVDDPGEAAVPEQPAAVQQLDDHLSREAELAIAGDFETVQEVMSAQQVDAMLQQSPQAGRGKSQADGGTAPRRTESTATTPGMTPPSQAASFARAAGASPSFGTARGADVADELDHDEALAGSPHTRRASSRSTSPDSVWEDDEESNAPPARWRRAAGRVSGRVRQTLHMVNRPAHMLPVPVRSAMGYIGLITLFNAGVLVLGALAAHFL